MFEPLMGAGGDFYPYKIPYSCRFNDNDSAKLNKTFASAGNQKTWTISFRVKRCNLGIASGNCIIGDASNGFIVRFGDSGGTNDKLEVYDYYSGYRMRFSTNMEFRDTSNWYHIVIGMDTTQATQADRFKMEVNGVQVTSFLNSTYPSQNLDGYFGNNGQYGIGHFPYTGGYYLDAYLADFHVIDGSKLDASNFGEFKEGIWVPKKYTGSHGTNGYHLDFADSSDLGKDVSGNGNDFTSSGLATDDQVLDSPTNNFATLSQLWSTTQRRAITANTLSNGNLRATYGSASVVSHGSAFPCKGKVYYEAKLTSVSYQVTGFGDADWDGQFNNQADGAHVYINAGTENYSIGAGGVALNWTPSANSIVMMAFDEETGSVWAGLDGTWFDGPGSYDIDGANTGSLMDGITLPMFVTGSNYQSEMEYNFGQLGFTYTPPDGFKAMCTENLEEPMLIDTTKAFDIVTYTGTGAELAITGVGHDCSVDEFVWQKYRDGAHSHFLFDTERGATNYVYSDAANAEMTNAQTLKSFDSDGVTLGTNSSVNGSGGERILWLFNMIAKYGMDIVTYTGNSTNRTISHGLGAVPEMIIVKNRSISANWAVYHHKCTDSPEYRVSYLDLTNAYTTSVVYWNNTVPTSSVFTVGTGNIVNGNGNDLDAYLFRSIPGLLKVGRYVGNNANDGTFIPCGFRPRFVLVKKYTGVGDWVIWDTARSPYNEVDDFLRPNSAGAEGTAIPADVLSDGFKMRTTNANVNNSNTFIYMAIADQPFKYANAF